jgi:hypothetical protein
MLAGSSSIQFATKHQNGTNKEAAAVLVIQTISTGLIHEIINLLLCFKY